MRISRFLPLVVGSAAAGILASIASPANAIVFNVSGTDYDITTTTTTYSPGLLTQLQSQPWWQNDILAQAAATAVGSSFGTTSTPFTSGPLFAYNTGSDPYVGDYVQFYANFGPGRSYATGVESSAAGISDFFSSNPATFAVIQQATPVPFETGDATIPIAVSSLIALGAFRKVKQTIALKTRVANPIKTVVS